MTMGFLTNTDYLFGYMGVALHILTKLDKGQSPIAWVKDNVKEFVLSLICYNILVYWWWGSGLEFFGMLKEQLSGLTIVLGYAGNSLIINLLETYQKRFTSQLEAKP